MRSIILMSVATLVISVLLVSCNNRDEGNKDTELSQARVAYDRCVSTRGQAYCNSAKAGTLASLTEFYGQSYYYNFYGSNNYLATNPGAVTYNVDQLNVYFENYLKSATKQDIMLMSNRWYQMTSEIGTNSLMNYNYGRRCTAYGCY